MPFVLIRYSQRSSYLYTALDITNQTSGRKLSPITTCADCVLNNLQNPLHILILESNLSAKTKHKRNPTQCTSHYTQSSLSMHPRTQM